MKEKKMEQADLFQEQEQEEVVTTIIGIGSVVQTREDVSTIQMIRLRWKLTHGTCAIKFVCSRAEQTDSEMSHSR